MMKPSSRGMGENPIPFNFDKFKEYDHAGKLITNDVIEKGIQTMAEIYQTTPAWISYSKEMIDNHVKQVMSENKDMPDSLKQYVTNDAEYLAVVRIVSGFFEGHSIVIKKIDIKSNNIQTEYSATDNAGAILTNLAAIENVVNNIVLMLIYEEMVLEEIKAERIRRLER